MATITQLESKLAEVLGLAQAAQQATSKVARLAKDEGDKELVALLDRMRDDAKETEQRCKALAEKRDGKKTAINKKARETKVEAGEMLEAYLGGEDADALDGLEFLIMAEAGELGHWEIVRTMAAKRQGPQRGQARRVGDPHPAGPLRHGPRLLAAARRQRGPQRARGLSACGRDHLHGPGCCISAERGAAAPRRRAADPVSGARRLRARASGYLRAIPDERRGPWPIPFPPAATSPPEPTSARTAATSCRSARRTTSRRARPAATASTRR
jgi:hypothetical protein